MFESPTPHELERLYQDHAVDFDIIQRDGLSLTQWAWLVCPDFWNDHPVKKDPDLWHWAIQNAPLATCKALMKHEVPPKDTSLTSFLLKEAKGGILNQAENIIAYLAKTPDSFHAKIENIDALEAGLAIRNKQRLLHVFDCAKQQGIQPQSWRKESNGNTLMHQAVLMEWTQGIKVLASENFDATLKNNEGLDCAALADVMDFKAYATAIKSATPFGCTASVSSPATAPPVARSPKSTTKKAPEVNPNQMDMFG